MKKDLVSVVITTKNSGRTFDRCLKSISNQSYKNIEIIVVDNNSTDDTNKIAKKYTKHIFNKGPERSAQRNYGARKAKGKYVLIHDSDIYFHKNTVKECVSLFENNGCDAIILPEKSIGPGFWTKVKAFEREFYRNNDLIEATRFFTRKSFLSVGGYDENLTGPEDWDLTIRYRKSNKKICRSKNILLHDEGRLTLLGSTQKKKYYSNDFVKYKRKHPKWYSRQMNVIKRFGIRKIVVKFFSNPILFAGFVLQKGMEWYYSK